MNFYHIYFQLNLSIFAGSYYDLSYNLYPLKSGWQTLPKLELKYNSPEDITAQQNEEQLYNNFELQNLVNRWMPKKIYIFVSTSRSEDHCIVIYAY